jgi:hypothetical protein
MPVAGGSTVAGYRIVGLVGRCVGAADGRGQRTQVRAADTDSLPAAWREGLSPLLCMGSRLEYLAVALAAPVVAQPHLTQAETDFIGSVAPQGYSGDVYGTVRAGHRVFRCWTIACPMRVLRGSWWIPSATGGRTRATTRRCSRSTRRITCALGTLANTGPSDRRTVSLLKLG